MSAPLCRLREGTNGRDIVFIHGLSATPAVFDTFAQVLIDDARLQDWGLAAFDYSLHSQMTLCGKASSLPDIAEMLYWALAADLEHRQFAVITHNAGGLLAQLAILEHPDLAKRVTHTFFFGPANAGIRVPFGRIYKAFALLIPALHLFAPLMRAVYPVYSQIGSILPGSALLEQVNIRWRERFAVRAPFSQVWIGATRDRLVLTEGLAHATQDRRFRIEGDHLTLVRPENNAAPSVQIVVRSLIGEAPPQSPREAARGVALLEAKVEQDVFDVFLHSDSADRDEVRDVSAQLSGLGFRVWLEEDHVLAGRRFRDAHAADANRIKAIALCIGKAGASRRLRDEDALLATYANRPIIPLFLPTAPVPGELLRPALEPFGVADLRNQDETEFRTLVDGIKGVRSARTQQLRAPAPTPAPPRRAWRRLAVIVSVLVGAALAAGFPAYEWYTASVIRPGAPSSAESRSHYVRRGNPSRVLVFVHGILGDAAGTWTHESNTYWPDLIAGDPAFDGSDIYVVQYDTGVGNRMWIDELANGLAERLEADRVMRDHAQVVFVTHSLGGLVTQRFLTLNRELGAKVPAFFLYGTPQTGAQIARALSLFSRDPLLKQMGDPDGYLKTILTDWRSAQRDWQRSAITVRRYCAYEKLPVNGVVIVDESSGTALCDDLPVAINANHLTIVKPASRDDVSYIFLKNRWPAAPAAAPPLGDRLKAPPA